MKVVVDTNVFMGALFHKEKWCLAVLKSEYRRELQLVMNEDMYAELNYIFISRAIEQKADQQKIYRMSERLSRLLWSVEKIPHKTKSNFCINDPSDNKFIDCAIDSDANFIITYNSDDLFGHEQAIKEKYGKTVAILSPYQFMVKFCADKINSR